MVGAAVFGHGTLTVHQEAVPATLLWQRRLVSLRDEGVQLALLTADGLHELKKGIAQWHMDMNSPLAETENICGYFTPFYGPKSDIGADLEFTAEPVRKFQLVAHWFQD